MIFFFFLKKVSYFRSTEGPKICFHVARSKLSMFDFIDNKINSTKVAFNSGDQLKKKTTEKPPVSQHIYVFCNTKQHLQKPIQTLNTRCVTPLIQDGRDGSTIEFYTGMLSDKKAKLV